MTIPRLTDEELTALRISLQEGNGAHRTYEPGNIHPEDMAFLQKLTRQEGRCGSIRTSLGWPCRVRNRPGFTSCLRHSTKSPASLDKADRALAAARMPAIDWLLTALDQAMEDPCPTCGYPNKTLKERKRLDIVATRVLDRTGLGPGMKIEHKSRPELSLDVSRLNAEESAELDRLLMAMDEFKTRVNMRLRGRDPVLEALPVPDENEVALLPAPAEGPGGESPL